ncbi:MAG: AgmX/PglI C-terminal domain-containing protein [Myxococcaceae bacterium]|nr:AgmX/PglI C-terminal domain-containing protein [Myxococcaceae bacterium]
MGTESKPGEGETATPWSEVSESELHALVDEVLRSGKHLTLPTRDEASRTPASERLHARAIAEQMRRLAHRIRSEPPPPQDDGPDDVDEWWFEIDGRRIGPISLRKVRYLWEDGELTPDSLCWHEGFSTWVSLFRVSELAEALAPRPRTNAAELLAEASRVPKLDRTTASGNWMPSAAEELHAANRLRLEAAQKPAAPLEEAPLAVSLAPPPPLDIAGTFATLPAEQPAPEPKRRGALSHALVTGLVAGLLISGAVVATRFLAPPAQTQPLVVVVHDAREPDAKGPRENPAEQKPARPAAPIRRVKPAAAPPKPARIDPAPAEARAPAQPSVDEAFAEQFGSSPDELESSEIAEVVAQHRAEIDACIRAQRAAAPELSGRLVMQWSVSLDGRVSDIRAQSAGRTTAALADCLKQAIAGWRFPKHEVPHGPVEFPFAF